MRATKAYIASLGTTGVLLGASILMLAVVGAVVAFDRWPEGSVSTRVQTLMIDERPAAIRVSADSAGPSATQPAGPAAPGRALARPPATTVPLQRLAGDELSGGGRPAPGAAPPAAALPEVPGVSDAVPDPAPIIDAIQNPDTTAGGVADGAQTVSERIGGSVGGVSPELGGAVTGTGRLAAQVVRDLPLPDKVLGG